MPKWVYPSSLGRIFMQKKLPCQTGNSFLHNTNNRKWTQLFRCEMWTLIASNFTVQPFNKLGFPFGRLFQGKMSTLIASDLLYNLQTDHGLHFVSKKASGPNGHILLNHGCIEHAGMITGPAEQFSPPQEIWEKVNTAIPLQNINIHSCWYTAQPSNQWWLPFCVKGILRPRWAFPHQSWTQLFP